MRYINIILSLFWLVFPVIVWYNFIGKEVLSTMTWEMIITLVAAAISLIGSIIISSYKERKQIRDSKDEILKNQWDDKDKILDNQRGIEKSLAASSQRAREKLSDEHREILEKQRDITSYILSESDKRKMREDLFSQSQKDTQRKVEEINDFLNDWQRLAVENAELKAEIRVLTQENSALRAENTALKQEHEERHGNEELFER